MNQIKKTNQDKVVKNGAIQFSEREARFCSQANKILGTNWEEEFASLLLNFKVQEDFETKREMQERHNSGHALFFFVMAVHEVLKGKESVNGTHRAFKALGHLICLREFLLDERKELSLTVNALIKVIQSEMPNTHEKWINFMYWNWYLIREFAGHYNEHDKCFPVSQYEKLCEIAIKKGS